MVASIRNSALQLSIQAAQSNRNKTKAPSSAATTKGIKKLMDLQVKRPSQIPPILVDLTDFRRYDRIWQV